MRQKNFQNYPESSYAWNESPQNSLRDFVNSASQSQHNDFAVELDLNTPIDFSTNKWGLKTGLYQNSEKKFIRTKVANEPTAEKLNLCTPGQYLAKRPDVRAAGIPPMTHFLRHGHREGMRNFDFFYNFFLRVFYFFQLLRHVSSIACRR